MDREVSGGQDSNPERVQAAGEDAVPNHRSHFETSANGTEEANGGIGSGEVLKERPVGELHGEVDIFEQRGPDEGLRRGYGAVEMNGSHGLNDRPMSQASPHQDMGEKGSLLRSHLSMTVGSSHDYDTLESEGRSGCMKKDPSEEKAATDADDYLAMGVLARAFPERFSALVVTLLVEIPTLFIISGGSDQLCQLIGRRRYQLLIAFLPLTSAISGNVGLQASTLTTRAVSHLHVTKTKFWRWLGLEIGAAFFLGISMGAALGLFAFYTSGNDPALGVTIFVAQFISIVTAGLTGTLAPLLFSFIFRRDSGQWGGPLETAIQDIIGSFAMIVLSYHTLLVFGTSEIDPDDRCGN